MKKILVVLLILAVAGGVFALGSGEKESNFGDFSGKAELGTKIDFGSNSVNIGRSGMSADANAEITWDYENGNWTAHVPINIGTAGIATKIDNKDDKNTLAYLQFANGPLTVKLPFSLNLYRDTFQAQTVLWPSIFNLTMKATYETDDYAFGASFDVPALLSSFNTQGAVVHDDTRWATAANVWGWYQLGNARLAVASPGGEGTSWWRASTVTMNRFEYWHGDRWNNIEYTAAEIAAAQALYNLGVANAQFTVLKAVGTTSGTALEALLVAEGEVGNWGAATLLEELYDIIDILPLTAAVTAEINQALRIGKATYDAGPGAAQLAIINSNDFNRYLNFHARRDFYGNPADKEYQWENINLFGGLAFKYDILPSLNFGISFSHTPIFAATSDRFVEGFLSNVVIGGKFADGPVSIAAMVAIHNNKPDFSVQGNGDVNLNIYAGADVKIIPDMLSVNVDTSIYTFLGDAYPADTKAVMDIAAQVKFSLADITADLSFVGSDMFDNTRPRHGIGIDLKLGYSSDGVAEGLWAKGGFAATYLGRPTMFMTAGVEVGYNGIRLFSDDLTLKASASFNMFAVPRTETPNTETTIFKVGFKPEIKWALIDNGAITLGYELGLNFGTRLGNKNAFQNNYVATNAITLKFSWSF